MNRLYKCTICCVLSIAALFFQVQESIADAPRQSWVVDKGDNIADVGPDGTHLTQISPDTTSKYALATLPLALQSGRPWKVSFEVKYGELRSAGTGVNMFQNGTEVGWMGADKWWKSMALGINSHGKTVYQQSVDQNWHQIEYQGSGSTVTIWLDGKNVGSDDSTATPDALKIGSFIDDKPVPGQQTEIWVRNVKVNGEVQQAPLEQPEIIDARPSVISVQNDEQSICCLPGDTLRVAGYYNADGSLYERFLDVNGSWLNKSTASGKGDDYTYNWTASKPGKYQLNASYLLQNNIKTIAHSYTVNVLEAPPVIIPLPKSAVYDVRVVAQVANKTAFHADRIRFQFNGSRLDSQSSNIMEAKLPINSLASGNYMLSYEAVDNNLGRFVGNTVSIYVPERLKVKIASNVTLIKPSDQTQADVELSPGVTISNISYLLDSQAVKSITQSPFSANLSFSTLPSGTHSIQAVATDSKTGRVIKSPVTMLTLVNQPDDVEKAQLAVLAAQRKAAEEQAVALHAKQQADEQTRLAKEEAERPAREAAAKLRQFLSQQPVIPASNLAIRCGTSIQSYFAAMSSLVAASSNTDSAAYIRLDRISDVKSSDSKIYPDNVFADVSMMDKKDLHISPQQRLFLLILTLGTLVTSSTFTNWYG